MNYTQSWNNANCLFPQEEHTDTPKLEGGPYTENTELIKIVQNSLFFFLSF